MQSLHDGSQFRHPDGFRWRPIFHHVVTQPCRLANPYVTRRQPIIPNTARGGSSFPVLDLIGWGHGGLDPVPLLHHRTCGFPHSAVELGATFSGCSKAKARYTYLAPACASSNKSPDFPLNHRKCPQTTSIMHPHSTAVRPLARLDQPLPPFRILSLSFSGELRSVFSSSSALRSGRLSAALFATTASDDSSSRLSPRRLPQVRCVNFRPAPPDSSRSGFRRRLDFAFSRTLIARIEPRGLFVFLRSCLGYGLLSARTLAGTALSFASVVVAISGHLLSGDKFTPMLGTRVRRHDAALEPRHACPPQPWTKAGGGPGKRSHAHTPKWPTLLPPLLCLRVHAVGLACLVREPIPVSTGPPWLFDPASPFRAFRAFRSLSPCFLLS